MVLIIKIPEDSEYLDLGGFLRFILSSFVFLHSWTVRMYVWTIRM